MSLPPPGYNESDVYWARLAGFRQADKDREEMVTELVTKYTRLLEQYQQKCDDLENEVDSRRMWHKRATQMKQDLTQIQHVTESNPLVYAIIDGDGANFRDDLIAQGDAGGSEAAHCLQTAIKSHLKEIYPDTNVEAWNIVVQVILNQEGLSNKLQSINLVNTPGDLPRFARAFCRSQPLFSFVDVGKGKEQADHKIREMLRIMIRNTQCRHIMFGPCRDNGYIPFFKPYELEKAIASKITLIETAATTPAFQKLGFNRTAFPEVFRSDPLPERAAPAPPAPITVPVTSTPSPTSFTKTPLSDRGSVSGSYAGASRTTNEVKVIDLAPTKRPKTYKSIILNVDRERLDESLPRSDPAITKRVVDKIAKDGKLCNVFHITGTCDDPDCYYVHGERVTPGEQLVLRHRARGLRCWNMSECRDLDCICGHHCRYGRNCENQHKCRFADTHHVKLTAAIRIYDDGTEEEIY